MVIKLKKGMFERNMTRIRELKRSDESDSNKYGTEFSLQTSSGKRKNKKSVLLIWECGFHVLESSKTMKERMNMIGFLAYSFENE